MAQVVLGVGLTVELHPANVEIDIAVLRSLYRELLAMLEVKGGTLEVFITVISRIS